MQLFIIIIFTIIISLSIFESLDHLDCLFDPLINETKVGWSVNWTFEINPKIVDIRIDEYNDSYMSCKYFEC